MTTDYRLNPTGIGPGAAGELLRTLPEGATGWDVLPLGDLSDVDTATNPAAVGDSLGWDGTNWAPQSANSALLFRGEWSADTLAWTEDFSGGSVPAVLNPTAGGYGAVPTVATVTNLGASGTPGSYANCAKLSPVQMNSTDYSQMALNITDLNLSGVTRVTCWVSVVLAGSNSTYVASQVTRNGSVTNSTYRTAEAWTQLNLTAAGIDTWVWKGYGGYAGSTGAMGSSMGVTGICVYTQADAYKAGQYVVHLGRLWRCTLTGTGQEPGTNTDWVEVPLGYDQAVATASRPTGVAAGAQVFDTTLGKPVWYTGTGWVDATGAAV